MENVFSKLLITSDPVISIFDEISSKKVKWLSADVLDLLELSKEKNECVDEDKSGNISYYENSINEDSVTNHFESSD